MATGRTESPEFAAQTAATTTSGPSLASRSSSVHPAAQSASRTSTNAFAFVDNSWILGEYLSDDLLLRLPHRQFVWTVPKCLRVYLKHDRTLFSELGKLIFALISEYYSQAAGRSLSTGVVLSHQTFGEFATFHPHWHTIILEGGFDQFDRFYFIPIGTSEKLLELWRRRVVAFFVNKNLLNTDMAASMLGWHHSGFSVESGTRIYDDSARQSLAQYIIRAPVGLEKLTWDRDEDTLSWKAPENGHFKGEVRYFDALDFIAQVTMHITLAPLASVQGSY